MIVGELAGDESSGERNRTFILENEGHTLGNALRSIICTYPNVEFCGYTVPHPAEFKMHFRIQMKEGRAIDALKSGLTDLVDACDHTVSLIKKEVQNFKANE